jgi:hypothetical protein
MVTFFTKLKSSIMLQLLILISSSSVRPFKSTPDAFVNKDIGELTN